MCVARSELSELLGKAKSSMRSFEHAGKGKGLLARFYDNGFIVLDDVWWLLVGPDRLVLVSSPWSHAVNSGIVQKPNIYSCIQDWQ